MDGLVVSDIPSTDEILWESRNSFFYKVHGEDKIFRVKINYSDMSWTNDHVVSDSNLVLAYSHGQSQLVYATDDQIYKDGHLIYRPPNELVGLYVDNDYLLVYSRDHNSDNYTILNLDTEEVVCERQMEEGVSWGKFYPARKCMQFVDGTKLYELNLSTDEETTIFDVNEVM